jgi:hypothetical protein
MKKIFSVLFFGMMGMSGMAQEKAEDTLSLKHALLKGNMDLHFRLYYMTTQNAPGLSDYYSWAFGGGLTYETGKFKGLQLGVGGFFIWNLSSSDLAAKDPASGATNRYEIGQFDMEDPANRNELSRLEAFYLKYNLKKSFVQLGRNMINTPLINPQDGRMRPTAVEGVWAEVHDIPQTTIRGGWIRRVSPRGTVEWYDVDQSIGIYSSGLNTDGSRSGYKDNLSSAGVGVLGVQYKPAPSITMQAWNYYIDNIMNSSMIQADGVFSTKGKTSLITGLELIHQRAVRDGGNPDPRKTYFDPNQTANMISGRLGLGTKEGKLLVNYTRITKDGRFLSPREWGRDPFYTFLKRERNEGFGDVHAFSVNAIRRWQQHRLTTELSYGHYDMPAVNDFAMSKYGLPSYHQFLADLTYDFKGFLEGMRVELLYTYKLNATGAEDPKVIINKVNMHHLNFIMNYRL